MKKFILAKKVSMTRLFTPEGIVVPATLLEAGPCTVTQVKELSKDGHTAVEIGFGQKRVLAKPQSGHLNGLKNFRFLRSFRVDDTAGFERGKVFDAGIFSVGDKVDAVGTSKGRGFAGVVKRHGFRGSPASHGHKDQLRMPGSIGSTAPQRVFKGTRMAGRMGNARITVRGLKVVGVFPEKHQLLVSGAVPGARNSLVLITSR